jgi:hypothetical protein
VGDLPGPFLRLLVPLWAFTAVFVLLMLVETEASGDFYKAASSIIPTLLLTLAVAGRFFLPGPAEGFITMPERRLRSEWAAAEAATRSEIESQRTTAPSEEIYRALEDLEREHQRMELYWERAEARAALINLYSRYMFRTFAGVVLLLLGAGEIAALWAIATETESTFLFAVASGAIAAGFAGVAVVAFVGPVAEPHLEEDQAS